MRDRHGSSEQAVVLVLYLVCAHAAANGLAVLTPMEYTKLFSSCISLCSSFAERERGQRRQRHEGSGNFGARAATRLACRGGENARVRAAHMTNSRGMRHAAASRVAAAGPSPDAYVYAALLYIRVVLFPPIFDSRKSRCAFDSCLWWMSARAAPLPNGVVL